MWARCVFRFSCWVAVLTLWPIFSSSAARSSRSKAFNTSISAKKIRKNKIDGSKINPKQISPAPTGEEPTPTILHALPPPPALPSHYRSVAVLPPLRMACDETTAYHIVDELLVEQIDSLPGLRAVSPSDVQSSLLPLELDALGCERDIQCLARAGRYARAHLALMTTISGQGGSLRVTLRLLQTEPSDELARYGEILQEDPIIQREQILHMLVRLLLPETYVGDILLQSEPSGANVFWNDNLLGNSPILLEHQPAGLHIVKFQQDGYEPVYRFVEVNYAKKTTFQVHLNSDSTSDTLKIDKSSQGNSALFVFYDPNQPALEAPWRLEFDGAAMGQLPMDQAIVHLPAGLHRITLKHPDQAPIYLDVTFSEQQRLDFVLTTNEQGQWELHSWGQGPLETELPTVVLAKEQKIHQLSKSMVYTPSWRLWVGLPCMAGGMTGLGLAIAASIRIMDLERQGQRLIERSQQETLLLSDAIVLDQNLGELYQQAQREQGVQWISYLTGGILTGLGTSLLIWEWVSPQTQSQDPSHPANISKTIPPPPSALHCLLPHLNTSLVAHGGIGLLWGCQY